MLEKKEIIVAFSQKTNIFLFFFLGGSFFIQP